MSLCSYSENSSLNEDDVNTDTVEQSDATNFLSPEKECEAKVELTTDIIMDEVQSNNRLYGGYENSESNMYSHQTTAATNLQIPSISSEAPHCDELLNETKLKCERETLELTDRRRLRKILKCITCFGTFSSSTRLEEHKSSCYKASSDNDDEQDNHLDEDDAMDEGTDWLVKSNRIINDVSSTSKPVKADNEIETDWKIESESDSQLSSDNEESDDDETYTETKPISSSSVKRNESLSCTKCDAYVVRNEPLKLKFHNDYFHSNGYISFQSRNLKNIRIDDLTLENFPSDTRHHPCPESDCTEEFTIPIELEMHTKLHHENDSNLTCNICDLTLNSIINLIDHELEHSVAQQQNENINFKKDEKYVCGRCNQTTFTKTDFTNHYLQVHLYLPPIQAACPICKQNFKNVERVPLIHFVNFHDLRRLDDPTKPFRCSHNPEECSAYFLTEDQLHTHWNKIHQTCGNSIEDNIANLERTEEQQKSKDKWKNTPKRYACPHCPKILKFACQLRLHICRRHTKGLKINTNSTNQIGKLVISSNGITVDDIVYNRKAKYFCSIENCKGGFMTEEDLLNHSKLHGNFKCEYCDVVKIFAPELAIHETVHSVGTKAKNPRKAGHSFSCVRCSFVTNKRHVYIIHHVEKHLGLKTDKKRCPICKYVYNWDMYNHKSRDFRGQILRHYATYHDLKAQNQESDGNEIKNCDKDECQAYFLTSLQLQQHILHIHENTPAAERCQCPDCGKLFNRTRYLREHRKRAHGLTLENLVFTCDVPGCNENYEKEIDLEYHILNVHKLGGRVQIECTVEKCAKKFWTKAALKSHLRGYDHRAKPRHVCAECGKWFKLKDKLDTHMEFHSGPETWKYSCSVCNKKIFSTQKLSEHMRTHTKEKPFVCQVCGVAYAHRHNLRIHVNNKHGLQDIAKKYDKLYTASSRKGNKFK